MFAIIIFITINLFFIKEPILSLQEINSIPLFFIKNVGYEYWPFIRIISTAIVLFTIFLTVNKYFIKNKNISLIFFLTIPWVFTIAHDFNPSALIFLLLLSMYLTLPKFKKILLILGISFLFYLMPKNISTITEIFLYKISLLPQFLNLTNLFTQMEPISSYMRIPRNGYFSYIFLIPLVIGLIKFSYEDFEKIKKFTIPITLSLLFFMFFPTNHLVFAGVGFLYLFTIFLIKNFLAIAKNKFFILFSLLISTSLFVFFLESYIRQYPMKYSVERSEAKIKVVELILNNPNSEFFIPNDEELKKLLGFYGFHQDFSNVRVIKGEINFSKFAKNCEQKNVECILDDDLLYRLQFDKNATNIENISLKNGLNFYYIF